MDSPTACAGSARRSPRRPASTTRRLATDTPPPVACCPNTGGTRLRRVDAGYLARWSRRGGAAGTRRCRQSPIGLPSAQAKCSAGSTRMTVDTGVTCRRPLPDRGAGDGRRSTGATTRRTMSSLRNDTGGGRGGRNSPTAGATRYTARRSGPWPTTGGVPEHGRDRSGARVTFGAAHGTTSSCADSARRKGASTLGRRGLVNAGGTCGPAGRQAAVAN